MILNGVLIVTTFNSVIMGAGMVKTKVLTVAIAA